MSEGEEGENELAELKALMERNAEAMAKLHAMVENLQRMLVEKSLNQEGRSRELENPTPDDTDHPNQP